MAEIAGTGQQPSPLAARLDALAAEQETLAEQRLELAMLIKQAVTEVDHLTQKSREVASRLRQVESHLDSFSREEIKQVYAASQEARMRLFMMQGQLEQLRSRQTSLEKMEQQLGDLIDLARALPASLAVSSDAGARPDGADSSWRSATQADDAGGAAVRSAELFLYRVSQQLQQDTAQLLSDLILRAEVCERMVEVDPERARSEMASLRASAAGGLRVVRHLIHSLYPPALEEMGLLTALRRHQETLPYDSAPQMDLQLIGREKRLPASLELALFRVAQEAISNAARHSGASLATLKVDFRSDEVSVSLSDDGSGFDLEAALAASASKERSGLAEMRSRARLAGGTLEIDTAPGDGCTVTFTVACPHAPARSAGTPSV